MSTLRVRVNKYVQSDGGPAPKVFARITQLDERGRSVPKSSRMEQVAISTNETESKPIALGSGTYLVEVRMPTGELLADSVRLGSGEDEYLVLMAESSPHEWLSWQHLAGNVATRSKRAEPLLKPAGTGSRSSAPGKVRSRGLGDKSAANGGRLSGGPMSMGVHAIDLMQSIGLRIVDGVVRQAESSIQTATWNPEEAAYVVPDRAVHRLGSGPNPSGQDFLRQQPWQTLAALQGSTANILAGLNAGRRDRSLEASVSDEDAAVFRIPNERVPESATFSRNARDFAAVHRRMGVELISLPTPWVETWSGRDAVVEVGVQRPRFESQFSSSVVVRDQQLAVLLGFLSSGALSAVKRLVETGNVMLFEKNENPLAAAAGGYALVGSAVDASLQPWHNWIENLMNRFEHIPDGAIQYGTMRLRLRKGPEDLREATRVFKLAYHRGLPFYGMGMRWLLDGLERGARDDEEAQAMATDVRRLASRLHPQSPFTILRLGKR